jgi:hypothetical protein
VAAKIKATIDTRQLDKYLTDLQRRKLPTIEAQALNKTIATVRTDTARKIKADKSLRNLKAVGKRFIGSGGLVVTKKASKQSLFAQISGNRNTLPLSKDYFTVSERKGSARKDPSVSVRLAGRKFTIRNAELNKALQVRARGKYSGNSFKFVNGFKEDAPLVRLKTFSVRSQLVQPYIDKPLQGFAFRAFDKELRRLLKRNGIL